MQGVNSWTVWLPVCASALLLDVVIMLLWRRIQRRKADKQAPVVEEVRVLGRVSPVAAWLRRYRGEVLLPWVAAVTPLVTRRAVLFERIVIVVLVLFYCQKLFNFDPTYRLPGNEAEIFQQLDQVFYQEIVQHGRLPFWNPYIYNGLPLVADPMFHDFNPLVGLPVLLFGPLAGFRVALVLSFVVGALGMHEFARRLGLGLLSRMWMALMFAFAGQPTARFFQGQYLFIFAWAWLPWALTGLVGLMQTGSRRMMCLTSLALALTFLSGNAYYAAYMVPVTALLMLVFGFRRGEGFLRLRFAWRLVPKVAAAGALALGITTVQLLPTIHYWPFISKSEDLVGSQVPYQVVLDFLSKDSRRADAYTIFPAREEFYAYTGPSLLLGLAAAPLLFRRGRRRLVTFALLLFLFSLFYINLGNIPLANNYLSLHFLGQFRHPIRMILFAEIALLLLTGLALDGIWRYATQHLSTLKAAAVGVVLAGFVLCSVRDVFTTNRQIIYNERIDPYVIMAFDKLQIYANGIYFTRVNPSNNHYTAAMQFERRLINAWYHYANIRPGAVLPEMPAVEADVNYLVQPDSGDETVPETFTYLFSSPRYKIYRQENSLPYAFAVEDEKLEGENQGRLAASEVTSLPVLSPNANEIVVAADIQPLQPIMDAMGETGDVIGGEDMLVVLAAAYPGWQVTVDDQPAQLYGVNGYLGVRTRPGHHVYHFTFTAPLFWAGLPVTLLSLALALSGLILKDGDWFAYVKRIRAPHQHPLPA